MMCKVGLIGLGIMGRPMAKHLLAANVDLMVCDINKKVVAELEMLGAKGGSYTQIGSLCDVIFLILPNGEIVQDVLFSSDGISENIKPGTIVCDMSSVTPGESIKCYEGLSKRGASFVDAPVSGGEPGAVAGTLAFMAGGDADIFEKLRPYFEIMGSTAVLVGKCGSGSITKLVNQMIVNNTIAVVSEAFVLAVKSGANPCKVYQAIRGGLAASAVLDAKVPMIINRNFEPGGKISINHKDVKNVISTAHAISVPVPYSAQLFEIMQSLKIHGYMDEDHGAIVKYFESLADIIVEDKGRKTEEI